MHALLGLLVATVVLVSGRGAEKLAPRYLDEFSVDLMKAGLRIQFYKLMIHCLCDENVRTKNMIFQGR